jgi:hypothetical protein
VAGERGAARSAKRSPVTVASAAWLPSSVAWFPATAYVVACAAVGVPTSGEPYAWVVIAQPPGDTAAALLGALVLVSGIGAPLLTLRRR